jgi:hypothetical protein
LRAVNKLKGLQSGGGTTLRVEVCGGFSSSLPKASNEFPIFFLDTSITLSKSIFYPPFLLLVLPPPKILVPPLPAIVNGL